MKVSDRLWYVALVVVLVVAGLVLISPENRWWWFLLVVPVCMATYILAQRKKMNH
jgi:hypothetical protein